MSDSVPDIDIFPAVHGRHGTFRYLPNDIYIGASMARYGEFSELETAFLCRLCKPGATVVDIGANIGTHTVPLARHLTERGRLFAFEPQPLLFRLLQANLEANQISNTRAFPVAAGNAVTALHLPDLNYEAEGNFGGVSLARSGDGSRIEQVRLDDRLDISALHLIKVDVEGMELAALQGAEGLIGEHRPLLYVENDREGKSAALIEHLLARDYRLKWHMPPLFNPDNFFGEKENMFGDIVSVNMLCVPAERFAGDMVDEIIDPGDRPWK